MLWGVWSLDLRLEPGVGRPDLRFGVKKPIVWYNNDSMD